MAWLNKLFGKTATKAADTVGAQTLGSRDPAGTIHVDELAPELHQRIQALCAEGDALDDADRQEDALKRYNEAWKLVPSPKSEWSASTWILTAIGDVSFRAGYLTSALEALEYAMHCPGALGNPFIHLRLGQVLFERGAEDRAADELARAFMGAGDEIFASEDSKYRDFLAGRMKP